jgi:hypothetical protein
MGWPPQYASAHGKDRLVARGNAGGKAPSCPQLQCSYFPNAGQRKEKGFFFSVERERINVSCGLWIGKAFVWAFN